MKEPLLLSVARVTTFAGSRILTGASSFFFERDERLFLVTNRHVLVDAPTGHHPDRLELNVHTDPVDLTRTAVFSVPLYRSSTSIWRQAEDSGGAIDVATIELDRAVMPTSLALTPFTPTQLLDRDAEIGIGTAVLVVGFPLGFYDTMHNLPVVRQATVASAFGVRFQQQGYFLTDARTHRGTSGAPVVMKDPGGDPRLPWKLLGIHSAGMDMRTREQGVDESLGLDSAWYADILDTLTV